MDGQAEPALDLIEPGTIGRCIVDVVARPFGQPCLDPCVLVNDVVVADQMYVQILRVHMLQELEKFLMSVLGFALGDHAAVVDVQRGEHGRGAVAHQGRAHVRVLGRTGRSDQRPSATMPDRKL